MRATRTKLKRCSALKVSLCGWAVNPIYSAECNRCPLFRDDVNNRTSQSKQALEPKIEEKAKRIDRFDIIDIPDQEEKITYMRKLRVTLKRLKR